MTATERHRLDEAYEKISPRVCPFCEAPWMRDSTPSRFECGRVTNPQQQRLAPSYKPSRACLALEAEVTAEL